MIGIYILSKIYICPLVSELLEEDLHFAREKAKVFAAELEIENLLEQIMQERLHNQKKLCIPTLEKVDIEQLLSHKKESEILAVSPTKEIITLLEEAIIKKVLL